MICRCRLITLPCAILLVTLTIQCARDGQPAVAAEVGRSELQGTSPLTWDEPLDVVMVRGINGFAERELAKSPQKRERQWPVAKLGTPERDEHETRLRARLRSILGVVDERRPPHMSIRVGAELSRFPLQLPDKRRPQVLVVQWDVLEGVTAEGLLLVPAGDVSGYAVAIPDASWTPEMFCGLADGAPEVSQLPRRLVQQGVMVLVPALISRDDTFSGHPDIRYTNIPHREFVYRMAFEMGRHIIGYEVQKMLAAVDVLEQTAKEQDGKYRIGVCGVGDGGMLAMHAAAIDPRINAALVCGYFQEREGVWREPIDRNVWSQLNELGDAEIASLAATSTKLIIEASAAPSFNGPRTAREGRPDCAAPGKIHTPPLESVRREFARLGRMKQQERVTLVETQDGDGPAGSSAALSTFAAAVSNSKAGAIAEQPLTPPTTAVDPQRREKRQLDELVAFTQRLLHRSDKVRAKLWSDADRSSPEAWRNSTNKFRRLVHDEMIGRLEDSRADLNPRSRKVIDEPTHVGYEVVLDVYPQIDADGKDATEVSRPPLAGLIAGGILLLPKDLKDGERRPVVVCQHGLEGTPMDTITTDESSHAWRPYKGFSTALVKRGFIVYAPQNPYRGGHHFRVIQRKSNPLGRSLFSYIIEQHRQTLKWLASLPYVDRDRIAFYGLSYGGKTAMRVPPLLPFAMEIGNADVPARTPGYCLSICSADFNEWIRKNVSSEDSYSYIFTSEYEMFEWNMGHIANYAELASLMVPRPFMVERGHEDGVAPDEWVAWEFAKVRRLYDRLGVGEKTEIEFFNGPHTINGVATFDFLHRHLNWPVGE